MPFVELIMGKRTENTEQDILTSVSNGSHKSFEIIYKNYHSLVFQQAFKALKCKSEADDIVQQTFVQIWQYKEKLANVRSLKSYIFIVSRNLIFSRLKTMFKNESLSEALKINLQVSHNKCEEDIIYADLEKITKEVIETLPKQRKLIFKLSKEMEYSQEEIAEQLSISKNTVKESLRKAYKQIRAKLSLETDIVLHTVILLHAFFHR